MHDSHYVMVFCTCLPSPANRPLSPPIEDVNAEGSSAIGMELTVVGLDHTSPTSAKTHLERLLRQIQQQKAVPDVIIHKGDVSGNLDYVHVSLHPALSAVPRPDVLQQLLTDINDLHQGAVHAKWHAGRGADKSRRIIFQVNSEEEMRTVHPLLREWFRSHNFAFQQDRTSNLGGRLHISFDVLRSEDIDTILTTPPYVNHHTYHATRPRFVEPTYGGEIAIGGCEVLQNPQAQFNMELRKKYGQDVVRFSRVALEGSTYTVVLRDWQTTNQFLEDFGEGLPSSWTRFRNITVGVPDLLYLFNSVGAPANPSCGAASSSPQVTHLQVQVDELRRQGAETVGTVNQVLAQTWRAVEKQNEVAQQMMASIYMHLSNLLVDALKSAWSATARPSKAKPLPAQRIRLDLSLAETEHEYGRVDKEKDTVAQQLSALQFAQGTQFLGQTVPHHNDADPSRPPEHGDDVPMSHERPPPEEDDNQHYEPRQRMSHDGGSAGPSMMRTVWNRSEWVDRRGEHRPHIWVINEMKSPTPAASCVRAPGYNTYENSGVQTVGSPAHGKWGVILGVSNTIHAQRVDTSFDLSLTGRVVAVDLVIPTTNGGFPHRLIGVYAPWDPGTAAGPDPQSSSAFGHPSQNFASNLPTLGLSSETAMLHLTSPKPLLGPLHFLKHSFNIAFDVWDAQTMRMQHSRTPFTITSVNLLSTALCIPHMVSNPPRSMLSATAS
ncbi:hypothetical protein DFH29DRAFT_882425 [Suillus ampliporus]|nr:hypothetical protein DFH29DRAFT_882425 [Suillus ampliporus]